MVEIKIRVYNTRGETRRFIYVIDIIGILDTNSFPEFEEKLTGILDGSGYNIVLNCRHLEFISSTCLGLLLKVVHSARRKGGDLCLLNPSASIQKVIKILGFSKFFRVFQDEEKVVLYFNKKISRYLSDL